jgi:hypothetical protein
MVYEESLAGNAASVLTGSDEVGSTDCPWTAVTAMKITDAETRSIQREAGAVLGMHSSK